MSKKKKEFKYDIVEIVEVLQEKNNWAKVLMRVSWNDGPIVYDIRNIDMRTIDSENVLMGGGISLSDEALDLLISKLLEEGYGDIKQIKKIISKRNSIFGPHMKYVKVRRVY